MKRVIVTIAFVAVVIFVLGYGYQTITSSADGTISPVTIKEDEPDMQTQRIPVENQYARFTYPVKFTRQGSENPVDPVVLNYNFIKQQVASWQISIQVAKLDEGKLTDDGSYNYRANTPARFTKETREINGKQAVIFTDTTSDTFAKTGYIQKGSLAAAFTMTGGSVGNYQQLQADFDALIASWDWR